MKLILPMNITAYEFDDLNEEAKRKVLVSQVEFWLETRKYKTKYKGNYERAVDKAEEMRTPWFTGEYVLEYCEKELIREIKANKYLFNEVGDFLPVMYHTKDNKVVKTTIRGIDGKNEEIKLKSIRKNK